jgi:hypothetical protein
MKLRFFAQTFSLPNGSPGVAGKKSDSKKGDYGPYPNVGFTSNKPILFTLLAIPGSVFSSVTVYGVY